MPSYKRILHELKAIEGRHTELISLYLAQGADLTMRMRELKGEQQTASNIKDKATRKNVVDALEKIIHHLRTYCAEMPVKGLALFCGNITVNGLPEIRL